MVEDKASAYLRDLGFYVSKIEFDGIVKRISRGGKNSSKSAWYIGWLEPYPIIVAGDWKTGEKWQWSDKGDLTASDHWKIRKYVKEAMAKAEVERSLARYIAKQKAKDFVASGNWEFKETEYTKRKQIDGSYGAYVDGDNLVIPTVDYKGEVWGLQTIDPRGRKLFSKGQRVKGCFHMIGEDTVPEMGIRVLLCEGFATGVSLHRATGGLVTICAFSAGNLGSVAAAIHLMIPKAEMIVCSDNDFETDRNPGLTEASRVAQVFKARLAVPYGAGTDFNDMASEFGLEAVRTAVLDSVLVEWGGEDMRLVGSQFNRWMRTAKYG